MGDIEKRLENLEHLAAAEPEQQPDLLLTAHEEQWERGPDDVLVPVKRQIIGYTETVWGSPGRNGGRIGHRRALYAGGQPSSFDADVPKTLSANAEIESV